MKRLILTLAIAMMICSIAFASGSNESKYEKTILSLDKDGTVEIKTDAPHITVVRSSHPDRGSVVLSGNGKSNYNMSVSESHGNLSVKIKHKNRWFFRVFGNSSAELTVTLPGNWTNGDIMLDSVSGSVNILDPISADRLAWSTVSGAIRFEHIEDSGNVSLSTVSGKIEGGQIIAQRATIESVSGAIEIDSMETDSQNLLEVSTVSGRIKLPNLKADKIIVDSVSGAIECNLPRQYSGRLKLKTVSGAIRTSLTSKVYESSDNRTRSYTFGDGNGSIEISTTSGAISIVE
ncbi:MAG: DUF4097 family beta strand repeat-containing protein [Sphaerochaetaceae bacterium]|jgi:DUF4097 and DUF4098 domain-containing protein YvlB|nr:DUF4097 family beta strand repeat-containing protein [Sphaerochaetaceae bacterium]